MRRALISIGLCMLLAGAVTGFLPLASSGTNCGSGFVESVDPLLQDLTYTITWYGAGDAQARCSRIRRIVGIPAIAFVVLGAGLAVGGLNMLQQRAPRG